MRGKTISHYRVLNKLGDGAMGEVYKAEDLDLSRYVALKFPILQDEEHRERFLREARAAAALNHPNLCAIYEVDREHGFLAMELVEGQTLKEKIAQRPLPLQEAIGIAIQIVQGLQEAHDKGVVHRDIKPGNVLLTHTGQPKITDFGLAQLGTTRQITRTGTILGTPAYMSPEQAEGRTTDHRTDLWSFGVVLYEMISGRLPFKGDSDASLAYEIVHTQPEPLTAVRAGLPIEIDRIVAKLCAKDPAERYQHAADLLVDLRHLQQSGLRISDSGASQPPSSSKAETARANWLRWPVLVTALTIVVATAAGGWWYRKGSRARWAEREALPEIARLMDAGQNFAALTMLREAERYLPSSPVVIRLKDDWRPVKRTMRTNAPGASIHVMDYTDSGGDNSPGWQLLGRSPIQTDRLPVGFYRVRAVAEGFEPVELAIFLPPTGSVTQIALHSSKSTPAGMVWVPGVARSRWGTSLSFPAMAAENAPEFWLDKYEVTNRQFKEFVEHGGYQKKEYWKHEFVKDGQTLPWERAVREFRDATGRPGPATWEVGTYVEGTSDSPVGGVSWFEAAAYAEFAGKSLPTVYQWYQALGINSAMLRFSNFEGKGPTRVGQFRGLGPYGTYDMGGNVKEWTLNPIGDRRYILGGGWSDPSYQSSRPDARSPFAREPAFGFRCASVTVYPAGLQGAVPFVDRDRRKDRPADEQAMRIYRSLHTYDKTDLKASVDSVDDSAPYWRKEKVTFQAAYGNERVLAHLYLPKNASPPYQVVTYFGGVSILGEPRLGDELEALHLGFILRSGRAVIAPAYKGTLERGPGAYYHLMGEPNRWSEMNLQWSKDLGRSIDYLESRKEIDTGKLAFYGFSLGAAMAPRLIAVERRFNAGLMLMGGSFERVPPEVDAWNFAPHVKVPLLMLSGRDDFLFPVETSQVPLFRLLGTPEKDKRHILHDGGHDLMMSARLQVVKESLDWLDRYLGPVKTRP